MTTCDYLACCSCVHFLASYETWLSLLANCSVWVSNYRVRFSLTALKSLSSCSRPEIWRSICSCIWLMFSWYDCLSWSWRWIIWWEFRASLILIMCSFILSVASSWRAARAIFRDSFYYAISLYYCFYLSFNNPLTAASSYTSYSLCTYRTSRLAKHRYLDFMAVMIVLEFWNSLSYSSNASR